MASLDQVALAVKDAVYNLLVQEYGTNPPAQIAIGWPYVPELSEILAEGEAQISIYPLTKASVNRTTRHPKLIPYSYSSPTLVATVTKSGSTFHITFSGSVVGVYNIHTLTDVPTVDARVQTLGGDTLDTIATKVYNAINLLGTNASATVSGAVTTVSGTTILKCNVGLSQNTVMVQEVRRTMTPIQVSVWAPNPYARNAIGALLENGLALDYPFPFLQASDGSAIWLRMRGAPDWAGDEAQRSYTLYEWHGVYEAEYPTLQTVTGTPVEVVGTIVGNDNTEYSGGQ